MEDKTLYLSSNDYESFEIIRKIERYKWITLDNLDYLVVDVDVPVDLTRDGLSNSPIRTLYLLNRFVDQEDAFKTLTSFPIYVHVLIPKTLGGEGLSSRSDFVNIAWATLYDNLKDAQEDRVI